MVTGTGCLAITQGCKMRKEWLYFWGRLEDGRFFHFARFFSKGGKYSHLSLDDKFYEGDWIGGKLFFLTPIMVMDAEPAFHHVMHFSSPSYFYYSIPFVKGIAQIEGKRVRADLWLEFESMEEPPSNWDWISLKLENESAVIIYTRERNPFAKFIWKDRELLSSFKVEEDKIILLDLNFVYKIEPIREEVIFNPKHGRPYSEQPINVICQGKKVGFGMRERTYKKMEEQDGKDKVI